MAELQTISDVLSARDTINSKEGTVSPQSMTKTSH